MSSSLTAERTTTAFDVLADPRRRYLLSILFERMEPAGSQSEPLSVETLATEVAVRDHGCPIVTDEQCHAAHIELVHHHVPRLLDVGLVTERDDGDTRRIALAEHPILETEWVSDVLADPSGGAAIDDASLDRLLDALQPARCRLSCAILARQRGELAVADLAAMITAHEEECRLVDLEESDWRPVATALRHNYLPSLAAADLVEYDHSSETVSLNAEAATWRADWLTASPLREVVVGLEAMQKQAGSDGDERETNAEQGGTGTYWTIDGGARVIERGHEIADSADEELFVTAPDEEMTRQCCLERWQAATERGVDVYIGSRSPRVRDTVRSAVPEATVCKPQFDWLNFPVDDIHHGRIVFADRERVMLVTADDADDCASAITGDGPANALVKLVREHIGPRLDQLQARCADASREHEQATPLPL
ncbi:DUF7344 domain-containing protein [Natronorubrum sulfidifaciens]|uniref:DUF7344 domain-containing protein n=1 Tax=Natronorubrum sulfidifaciens JCM 14089 TaxID=1230460 RepID=L9W2N5_9EURY|nr:hypothetical protein [Natronorubrum sulfidifaciens]ELY43720.1 hypothetical protein C495_12949 [Natronorubrum sulfidifaciens JCM 14089]